MIVTFVSNSQKGARPKTCQILDTFANRIGDNVWQTTITQAGLKTVHEQLKLIASKSKLVSVSCHRIKTRHSTELLWIVGNKTGFDETGKAVVASTKRNLLHLDYENDWHFLSAMHALTTLAGLFHDIGKSSDGFQHKLAQNTTKGDPYRHEWISFKLLCWLIGDCQSDKQAFTKLANLDNHIKAPNVGTLQNRADKAHMDKLPPLIQWLAWLILTHHRLPPLTDKPIDKDKQDTALYLNRTAHNYYKILNAFNNWVKNSQTPEQDSFWQFQTFILDSPLWQKQVKRYAQKVLNSPYLTQLSQHACQSGTAIADPFLLHLSRMSLMMGDHHYSSLSKDSHQRLAGNYPSTLAANTCQDALTGQNQTKQSLDEHLLGVARFAGDFVRLLPTLHHDLPRLQNHNPLIQNTANPRFDWQNKAFKLALKQQNASQTHGFFGVNMASTGMGKTIGNTRIMYALNDPKQGSRLTIALGLRVLTLQTGQSFRRDLHLSDKELAILVGGLAQKQLFELAQNDNSNGSESAQTLFADFVDADDWYADNTHLGAIAKDDNAQKLLCSPVVVCTIDHLMPAAQCKRGGRFIVPMLRLFGSDLILDEPDDYDQSDLPALSRLVHLAGVLGSRVLLSSATLTPDLVAGLFYAYQAGRTIYNAHFNKPAPSVVCAWFDEQSAHACQGGDFAIEHKKFVQKRVKFLNQQPIKRIGSILPIAMTSSTTLYSQLGKQLLTQATILHAHHHDFVANISVSVGLVRFANIEPLIKTIQAMQGLGDFCQEQLSDCQFYVACYHAHQVLLLRNQLENRLDTLLKRTDNQKIANHPDIAHAIAQHPHKTKHIFMVLATPVAEVGRDHDYDWAIIEPSSMRSIIQLAGRVQRHRHDSVIDTPNIAILQYNLKALKQQDSEKVAFTQPGFESSKHKLNTHNVSALLSPTQYQAINAIARIDKADSPNPTGNLADLEHSVMANLMNNSALNVVNAYWQDKHTANRLHTHLSTISPFRDGSPEQTYIIKPHPDGTLKTYTYEALNKDSKYAKTDMGLIHQPISWQNPHISTWLEARLYDEYQKMREHYSQLDDTTLAMRFCTLSVPVYQENSKPWQFDEYLGCWRQP